VLVEVRASELIELRLSTLPRSVVEGVVDAPNKLAKKPSDEESLDAESFLGAAGPVLYIFRVQAASDQFPFPFDRLIVYC